MFRNLTTANSIFNSTQIDPDDGRPAEIYKKLRDLAAGSDLADLLSPTVGRSSDSLSPCDPIRIDVVRAAIEAFSGSLLVFGTASMRTWRGGWATTTRKTTTTTTRRTQSAGRASTARNDNEDNNDGNGDRDEDNGQPTRGRG